MAFHLISFLNFRFCDIPFCGDRDENERMEKDMTVV